MNLVTTQNQQQELAAIITCNKKTEQFGLSLTPKQANQLIVQRNESLKKYQRVEFGKGILDKLVFYFCDSQYLNQDNYAESLSELQDIFYLFKNECEDRVNDEQLLNFMKQQFETVCTGDLSYLATTCLERFSRLVRSGYSGFDTSDGFDEYEQIDEEPRWDNDLYMQVLTELCWR